MSHRILSDGFQTDRILSTWVGIPALGNRSEFILNPTKNRQQKTIFLSVFCRIQDKFRSVSERQDFDGSILDLVESSPNPTGIAWESDRIRHDSVIGSFDLGWQRWKWYRQYFYQHWLIGFLFMFQIKESSKTLDSFY